MSEPSRETSGRRIWSRRRRGDHPAGVIPHQSYQDPGPPGPGFFAAGGNRFPDSRRSQEKGVGTP